MVLVLFIFQGTENLLKNLHKILTIIPSQMLWVKMKVNNRLTNA